MDEVPGRPSPAGNRANATPGGAGARLATSLCRGGAVVPNQPRFCPRGWPRDEDRSLDPRSMIRRAGPLRSGKRGRSRRRSEPEWVLSGSLRLGPSRTGPAPSWITIVAHIRILTCAPRGAGFRCDAGAGDGCACAPLERLPKLASGTASNRLAVRPRKPLPPWGPIASRTGVRRKAAAPAKPWNRSRVNRFLFADRCCSTSRSRP